MSRISLALLLIAMTNGGCSGVADSRSKDVSIRTLIDSPERFDNQVVAVRGFIKIEGENTNIYGNESAAKEYDDARCMSLLIPEGHFEEYFDRYNDRYGKVVGEFTATACADDEICTWICRKSGIVVQRIIVK